jgi:hypothetical protein
VFCGTSNPWGGEGGWKGLISGWGRGRSWGKDRWSGTKRSEDGEILRDSGRGWGKDC